MHKLMLILLADFHAFFNVSLEKSLLDYFLDFFEIPDNSNQISQTNFRLPWTFATSTFLTSTSLLVSPD